MSHPRSTSPALMRVIAGINYTSLVVCFCQTLLEPVLPYYKLFILTFRVQTPGEITYGDVLSVLPFGNTLDTLELEGRYVKAMLENCVDEYDPDSPPGKFLQFSGKWISVINRRDPEMRMQVAYH